MTHRAAAPGVSGEAPKAFRSNTGRPPVVHLVHGTWAYGPMGRESWEVRHRKDPEGYPVPWFHRDSLFCKAVEAHYGSELDFRCFGWSGDNTFVARRQAAESLRKHLRKAMEKMSDAAHVVVAHSHGGTVAFDAVARTAAGYDPLPRPLHGLLTLGTPFARLREIENLTTASLVRGVAPRWLWVLLVAAGVALGITRWFDGGYGTFTLYLLATVFLALLGLRGMPWLVRRPDGLADLLSQRHTALSCPLHALRTPGDEAGFAIAAAQLVDWVGTRVSVDGILGLSTALLRRWGDRLAGWAFPLALWIGIGAGWAVRDAWAGDPLRPWWAYVLLALFYAGTAMTLALATLALAVPVIVAGGLVALRLAVGPEASRYAGNAVVEVETLPVGLEATMEVLPASTAGSGGLSHSLHERPTIRARVAEVLRGWLTPVDG